jgi:hypothetical protein
MTDLCNSERWRKAASLVINALYTRNGLDYLCSKPWAHRYAMIWILESVKQSQSERPRAYGLISANQLNTVLAALTKSVRSRVPSDVAVWTRAPTLAEIDAASAPTTEPSVPSPSSTPTPSSSSTPPSTAPPSPIQASAGPATFSHTDFTSKSMTVTAWRVDSEFKSTKLSAINKNPKSRSNAVKHQANTIAKNLFGETRGTIRPWSKEESAKLHSLYKEYGNAWLLISKHMNRTPCSIRNHWVRYRPNAN